MAGFLINICIFFCVLISVGNVSFFFSSLDDIQLFFTFKQYLHDKHESAILFSCQLLALEAVKN